MADEQNLSTTHGISIIILNHVAVGGLGRLTFLSANAETTLFCKIT